MNNSTTQNNTSNNINHKNKEEKVKTILIIGISSFVGSTIAEYLKYDYKVVGTYCNNPVNLPEVVTVPCDIFSKDEVQFVLYAFKPEITIYCAGLSSITMCDRNENLSDVLNTSGFFSVNEYCQRYQSRVIYISSSFVFDGEDKNNIEIDIPYPNTIYGKSKSSAEFFLQKTSLNYLIFRCSNLYGLSGSAKPKNFFETLQKKFTSRESFVADDLVHVGFLDIYYLAAIIKLCIQKDVKNRLFQVSSSDAISHYDFSQIYAKIFNENSSSVSRGQWKFPIYIQGKRLNISQKLFYKLDTLNIESYLNILMPTVEESLIFTFERLNGKNKSKASLKNSGSITFI